MRPSAAVSYAIFGALLSVGAPVGWLLTRMTAGGVAPSQVRAELHGSAALYGYLLVGTGIAFVTFGAALGAIAEKLAAANRRLIELSTQDALTGLRNRRAFHERLIEECARADRAGTTLSLIELDLDEFKQVNDRYGHASGDRVLEHVGQVIAGCARATDIACRIGGEEFAVICPRTTAEQAMIVAERIRQELNAGAVFSGGIPIRVTASFGVSDRATGTAREELYTRADAALYRAKALGRNRVERHDAPAGAPRPTRPGPGAGQAAGGLHPSGER